MACDRSFDGLAACGVNDTTFFGNHVARKGGAVVIASESVATYVEFHRCTMENSTVGIEIDDDPQGKGGAIAVGQQCTLLLANCTIANSYCGKKVRKVDSLKYGVCIVVDKVLRKTCVDVN